MTLIVVKRDEDELARWLKKQRPKAAERLAKLGLDPNAFIRTELGFLTCLGSFNGSPLELDLYQVRFLRAGARFRSLLKSRQVGYSWIMAAEMLARCHLRRRHVAVCISYNLDDAKEKISLVKELHDELPLEYQKKLVVDSKTEVAFQSNSSRYRLSKIHSMPSKAPRGKSGDVYIDEFAHCLSDKVIYAGATSVTVRSKGQLTVGSTPMGKRGMFYRIHTQAQEEFSTFWRQEIPWWLARNFCVDVVAASREALEMETAERVKRFGTRELVGQFSALPIDDFKQEYELEFQDERVAFFPVDLVLTCCRKDRGDADNTKKDEILVHDTVESLAIAEGGPLYAGFDVGRTKHPSELYIVEKKDGGGFILRYHESYRDLAFEDQRRRLDHVIETLGSRLRAFRIDKTGMGMNLSENLRKKHGAKVEEWQFTAAAKVELANNLKILFENQELDLLKDRDLITQLGSVRQKISESGQALFDVEKNKRHHGDKVWALALATWRKGRPVRGVFDVGIRVLGEPKVKTPLEAAEAPRVPSASRSRLDERDLSKIFEVDDANFKPRRPEFAPPPPAELVAATEAAVLAGTADDETLLRATNPTILRRLRVLKLSIWNWVKTKDFAAIVTANDESRRLKAELDRRLGIATREPMPVRSGDLVEP